MEPDFKVEPESKMDVQHGRLIIPPGCTNMDILSRVDNLFPKGQATNILTTLFVKRALVKAWRGERDWSKVCSLPQATPTPGVPFIRSWEEYRRLQAYLLDAVAEGSSNDDLQEKAYKFHEQMRDVSSEEQIDTSSANTIRKAFKQQAEFIREAKQEHSRHFMYLGGIDSECPRSSGSPTLHLSLPQAIALEFGKPKRRPQNKDTVIDMVPEAEADTPTATQSITKEEPIAEQQEGIIRPQSHSHVNKTEATSEGHKQADMEDEVESQAVGPENSPQHLEPNGAVAEEIQASEETGQNAAEPGLPALQDFVMPAAVDEGIEFTEGLLSPNTVANMFEASLGE